MLNSPNPRRRVAGRLIVLSAVVVALPLTAGRAVKYVDAPSRVESAAPIAHSLAEPMAAAVAAVQASRAPEVADPPVAAHSRSELDGDMNINEQLVTIDGKRKRWEDLTPTERARVRAAVGKARTALANTHIDQAKIERDLVNVPDRSRIDEMQRQLAGTHARIAENIRRMDAEAAQARAAGREPDRLEAAIRARLQAAQDVDFGAASRALASIDRQKIAAEVTGAEASVEKAKAELARIQARLDADQYH